ncbi:substrate-binding periplasmic protein [Alteromonas sp. ASW11-130]|uniref:substrate-binding periplasmic protein n=1 Tax=Alteromonas sp. ASW11-130 TaxID=3015775 RepID=UPI002242591F|nr:transporter substrate-binding domain-containing protein [Alteromonas sp. ASW11-130]MCW8092003.1 transporter substrate-binding domain-containing protein [Alteromonas sp. ASW11-130]
MKAAVIFFLTILLSSFAYAEKERLNIAVNLGPPWAYYDATGKATGIDVETIRAVFNELGYTTHFWILPYNRLIKEFNDEKFDFASPAAFHSVVGFRTTRYLPYRDVAITRKADGIRLHKWEDLKSMRIVAYQHALHVLGPEFEKAVSFSHYIELAERDVQLKLLAFERTDVVVGEKRLLHYILKENHAELEVTTHNIFPVQHYGGIGLDEALVQQFNRGVNRFINNGHFEKLLNKWEQNVDSP